MVAKVTRDGQSPDDAIDWAAGELEQMLKG
jgi:hypothetical protein